MTSRVLKGGLDPVKTVRTTPYSMVKVDDIPVARCGSPHMLRASAEYYAWKYNLDGYTDAERGFIKCQDFKYQKWWPTHMTV